MAKKKCWACERDREYMSQLMADRLDMGGFIPASPLSRPMKHRWAGHTCEDAIGPETLGGVYLKEDGEVGFK
jgi:hypothetical protein